MKLVPTSRWTALLAGLALLAACAQASLQDEAVTSLRIEGPVELALVAGAAEREQLKGGLRRTREGNNLVLSTDSGKRGRLSARLSRLSIARGADVAMPELQADLISLKRSGSGRLSVNRLQTRQLLIDISGSGDLRLGRVEVGERAEAKLAGSGDLHIERLRAQQWQGQPAWVGGGACRRLCGSAAMAHQRLRRRPCRRTGRSASRTCLLGQ